MRLLFFLLFWGAETGIDGGRSEGGRSRSGRGRARVGAGERGAGGGEGGRAFALFGGALRRKDGRGLRALRGRDDSFRLVHGINNPSVRLVPRPTPSRAVETALSSPQSQHVRLCVPRGLTARLASPLPTHLLRICAGALKRHGKYAVSKFAGGKEPTSSRQGGLVCGALRLPHDLIRLPLLFPQNSPCDFCGSPEIIPQSFCCAKSLREP